MPHALIAAFDGDTVAATEAFANHYGEVRLISLVDFHNDCVTDALKVAEALGDRLWGVRLDTSENMVDRSIHPLEMGDFSPTGVNPHLVRKVRRALDQAGHHGVKIGVSGGFTHEKIRQFESLNTPVDFYAVGSSLLQGANDFTADVVFPTTKAGRRFRLTGRLDRVV
jgi:nicotinate phosphoribosyltransferase